jgi:polar amino acid transport system permease protein
MTPRQALRRVVLPQAVKRMIPAFHGTCHRTDEDHHAGGHRVSYADLLFQANEVAQKTFRPLEVFTTAALLYFVVISRASLLAQALERRLAVSGEGMGPL